MCREGHHDRPPHEEREEAAQEAEQDNDEAEDGEFAEEVAEEHRPGGRVTKEVVEIDKTRDGIDGLPNHDGHRDGEPRRDDGGDEAGDEEAFVVPEEVVEPGEGTHVRVPGCG